MGESDAGAESYREHLLSALQAASRDYDQAILTLSAAALTLSVTFAHDIAPVPEPNSTSFLLASWVSLASSLAAMVASFQTSQHVLRQLLEHPERDEATGILSGLAAKATHVLNFVAGALLVLGLGLFGWYAFMNT